MAWKTPAQTPAETSIQEHISLQLRAQQQGLQGSLVLKVSCLSRFRWSRIFGIYPRTQNAIYCSAQERENGTAENFL